MFSSKLKDERLKLSKAQLKQDIFVLDQLQLKEDGYFVEFGATNGILNSNTWLLENHFNWTGILAEPSIYWHDQLHKNRSCHIDTACIWTESNQSVLFNEVDPNVTHYANELSTIDVFSGCDTHADVRSFGKKYPVSTLSLLDLLKKYSAPQQIDYLSIDTEGSELEILQAFDFNQYTIKIITCEHNYTPAREHIHDFLEKKGYVRKLEQFSAWDDWYILSQ